SNNKTRAAEILGISLKTLHNKLKEYGAATADAVPGKEEKTSGIGPPSRSCNLGQKTPIHLTNAPQNENRSRHHIYGHGDGVGVFLPLCFPGSASAREQCVGHR